MEHEKTHMKLRPGRISNLGREEILVAIGEMAQERYDELIRSNHRGYNLDFLQGGLQFRPDINAFENEYWVQYESEEKNRIATYFEHGTGLYNENGPGLPIEPVVSRVLKLRFRHGRSKGKLMFSKSVKGVRPVFMFERTMSELNNNRAALQRHFRIELGV